jgi:penicillin-binding protein-related factor A (putative recombinase)
MQKVRITESQLKSIVKRIIKEESSKLMEMGKGDINFTRIIQKYDNSTDTVKKTITEIILGRVDYKNFNPDISKTKIEKELSDMDYQDISKVAKMIGLK